MMILKRITAFSMLAALCVVLFALPAAATTTTSKHDGLEVTIEMDKEHYLPGEEITAKITVKNTGIEVVMIVNLEQLIPEGYKLSENAKAAAKNIELRPEQTFELEVTYEGGTAEADASAQGFFDRLIYGETWGIPNLLIAVVLLIAFVVFMLLT